MGTAAAAAATGPPPAQRAGRFDWERALDHADLPQRTVAVAFALATFANSDGTRAHPGEAALAVRSHLPPSTVREHLKRLRDTGWARRVSRGSTGATRHEADEYHLCVPVDVLAAAAADELVEVLEEHDTPAPAVAPPPPTHRRSSTSPRSSSTSTTAGQSAVVPTTTAGQSAVVEDDHRWLAGRPPLASEQTTAGQPAPTKDYQGFTKGGAADAVVDRPRGAAPRCPRHSDIPPDVYVKEPCRDCADMRRAFGQLGSDYVKALLRARRACTDCDDEGWLLATPLNVARRCHHPNVPAAVWAGAAASSASSTSTGGRHRRDGPPAPPHVPSPRPTTEDLARAV